MIISTYIVAPLVGGFIGYITNDIAIRMLFRPHTAKYIFGMKVPFTPGIIPKEKGRIAEAIGDVISNNLMNKEVLEKTLLSDEMLTKIRTSIDNFVSKQKNNDETVEQFLCHFLSKQEIDTIAESIHSNVAEQITAKLSDETIGKSVAKAAMDYVSDKISMNGASELIAELTALGTLNKITKLLLGGNVVAQFLKLLREPTEKFLAKNINNMLRNNGVAIVDNLVNNQTGKFRSTKVKALLAGKDELLSKASDDVVSLYQILIKDHLPKILENIDISRIVRDRINEMDVNETEKLIFQVMDKELKAIVWLGALLGLIMGCVNIFI